MYKWIIAGMGAVLLFGAGCQKKTLEDTAAKAPQASQATQQQIDDKTDQLHQPVQADDNLIGAKLQELAPQYGYAYSADNVSLTGPGTPPEGVKLPVLISEVHAAVPADAAAPTPEQYEQAVRDVLQAMVAKAPASSKETAQGARPEPVIPKSVTGTWRTVREEQGQTMTVQHDDKYYEQIAITENMRIGINVIRDGQLFDQQEYGYRYDPGTGKLTMLTDKGVATGAFYFKTYPDRPQLMYVTEDGNDIVKVYENIGGGAKKAGQGGAPAEGGPTPTAPKQGK
jgi:hypothetical protein